MELGQALFGNRTQDHEIKRGKVGDVFLDLLESVGLDSYGHPREAGRVFCDDPDDASKSFDNGTFVVRPYYWGECTCGFGRRENAIDEEHPHAEACFHTRLRTELGDLGIGMIGGTPKEERERATVVARHCEGTDVAPADYYVGCTCERKRAFARFYASPEGEHAPTCRTTLPNFEHHPTGLRLSWYKYAFRGVTANRPIDLADMREVAASCVASFGRERDVGVPAKPLRRIRKGRG